VIIPVMLLSSFVETTSWRGIQTVFVMGCVGLVMKHFGRPRPPMLLAFILAPIIELNLLSAFSVYGVAGVFTDLLTMTIIGIAVLTAIGSVRAMQRVERETAQAEALLLAETMTAAAAPGAAAVIAQPPAPGPQQPSIGVREPDTGRGRPSWRVWHWEYAVHASLILISVLWLIDASGYSRGAGRFPIALCIGVLALTLCHAVTVLLGRGQQGHIMDLGMISVGIEGARRASVRLALLLGLFVVIGTTLHLAYAAVALGFLVPVVMLRGLGRYPIAVLTAGLVFVFSTVLLDSVLAVVWPEPFITGWEVPWGLPSPGL
jgi:hypothetical protein